MTDKQIRVLIADDHPVVRDGLLAVLETQADFDVVGVAQDGDDALQKTLKLLPDVVLMDLEMPGLDGVEAIRRINSEKLGTYAIVFTAFDTDERIIGALQAGARGYLLKGAARDDIFRAIRTVHGGGSLIEPVVMDRVMARLNGDTSPDPNQALPEPLTERETEVLHLVAQGKPNKEIAADLFITERTVKFYVSAILGKLNATNRTEAVAIAAQRGLVKL